MQSVVGTIAIFAVKDAVVLSREKVSMFFLLVFPLLFGILFGLIFASGGGGGSGSIALGVIDRDGSELSARFVERLRETGPLDLTPLDDDVAAARDAVRRGQLVGVIEIPAGLEAAVDRVLLGGQLPEIAGAVDPSRRAASGMLPGLITGELIAAVGERLTDPDRAAGIFRRARESIDPAGGVNAALLDTLLGSAEALVPRFSDADAGANASAEPAAVGDDGPRDGGFRLVSVELESVLRDRSGQPTAFELTFPQACAWALIGCVTGLGLSLVQEREGGTMVRLAAGPTPRWALLASKAVACFVASVLVLAGLHVIGSVLPGGIRVQRPGVLFLSIAVIAFAFTGIMSVLASVSQAVGGAEGISRAVLLVLALIGGAGVPLVFLDSWVLALAAFSPFRWAIQALEAATFRNSPLSELWGVYAILLSIGAAGMALGAARFARWRLD